MKLRRLLKYASMGKLPKTIQADITYLSPNKRLFGKKIVITGGTRGIGYAMARKFKDEGADVLITGRKEETIREVGEKLGINYLQLDICDIDSFDSFISESEKILGGIDCLVNNAGISLHEKTFFDVTKQSFDTQINTNFRGPFFLSQTFIRYLEEQKKEGTVLFVSSETGMTSDIRPYGLTKAAVNSLVQGLAYLLAEHHVRINAIAPGVTATSMTGRNCDENLYYSSNMNERIYLPDEVAECACFLLSDASGCISGEILTCNNGKTINARWK